MEDNKTQSAAEQVKQEDKKVTDKSKKNKQPKEPIDKKDMMCYIGSVCFLLLAFIPLILRGFDPNYDPYRFDETKEPTTSDARTDHMFCKRTFQEEGYSYVVEINSSYTNEYVTATEINYTITINKDATITLEEIEIPEYATLSEIDSQGINVTANEGKYTIKIDYKVDPGLRNNELLEAHIKKLDVQRMSYEGNSYSCNIS